MTDYVEYQYRLDTIVECCLASYSILNEASGSSIIEKFNTALLKGWQILKSLIDKLVAFIHRLVTGEKIYAATIKYDKNAIYNVIMAASSVYKAVTSVKDVLDTNDSSKLVSVDETRLDKMVKGIDNIQNWKEESVSTKKLYDDSIKIQKEIDVINDKLDIYSKGSLSDKFLKIIYDNKEWYNPIAMFKNKATVFLRYILEQIDTINSKNKVGEITIPIIKEEIKKLIKTHKSIKRVICYRIGNSGIALSDADNDQDKVLLKLPGKLSAPIEKLFKNDNMAIFKV